MKKTLQFWMLLVMALSIVSCNEDNDNSIPAADVPLNETLAANKLFSDIEENPDVLTMKKKSDGKLDYKSQYSMCFRQAVNHDQPDGETFQQRVCILFRSYDRPTILVTEGYLWDGFGVFIRCARCLRRIKMINPTMIPIPITGDRKIIRSSNENGGRGFGSAYVSLTISSSVFGAFSRRATEREAVRRYTTGSPYCG